MSPRRGGEADKFGNRYEGRWTVRHLLYVLLGRVDSVTVEEAGDIGRGAEFIVRYSHRVEAHQVKRQVGNANEWSLSALKSADILSAARKHVTDDRAFHFLSIVPARTLDELSDRARGSASVQSFLDNSLTRELQPDFTYLSGPDVFGSVENAWKTLRGIEIRWPDERDLRDINSALAGLLLEGAEPPLAAVALGDLAVNNLNVPLDAVVIERELQYYGLRRARLLGSQTLVNDVHSALNRWKDSVVRELLEPVITREETARTWGKLRDNSQTVFVVGDAGGGKSAVIYESAREAETAGWKTLALRLDRLEPFASPVELGQRCGLGVSPVSALAAVSSDRPCLLVIDQVDAVSMASGRMPASFDAVASLIREAAGFSNMRVLLGCRKFDVDNDERIRAVIKQESVAQVEVGPLSNQQVAAAVRAMGIDTESLTDQHYKFLSSPFNLVLLSSISDQPGVLSIRSARDLLDEYWERKRRDCRRGRSPAPRFNDVIGALVDAMSERQRLAAPVTVLDRDDLADDALVLESEHIIVRDGRQYAFFHEAFFDYAFARGWIEKGESLVDFLLRGDQELFRRTQVRQVLNHLHEDEPDRFVREVEGLLVDPRIRFHIKDVVLALLRFLPEPTSAEWAMVKRVIEARPEFIGRLWLALRTLAWFDRLDAEGEIQRMLNSGNRAEESSALDVALGGMKERTDRLAEILAPHAGRSSDYPYWLRWVARFANLHRSRPLLDLVIDSVRRGEYAGHEDSLWMSAFKLADHQPTWAVDLLSAYLQDQPGAFNVDGYGRIALLGARESSAEELATTAGGKAPNEFCVSLLPYLQKVMTLTEYNPTQLPVKDHQFSFRDLSNPSGMLELDDALLLGARTALRAIVTQDSEQARRILDGLATDRHETAQCLLYDGLKRAPEPYAEWAAELLLEGDHRLIGSSATVEMAADLLKAVSTHVTDDTFSRLEQSILQVQVPWEGRPNGWSMFNLLAALEQPRLSELGRRRLGELRRLFKTDQPPQRPALSGGFIDTPIPQQAARLMTDDQWLRAIQKYNSDRENWTTMRGGAVELSRVLQNETATDPSRFARFALRLTGRMHPAYAEATLMGLGNAQGVVPSNLVFDAIRHLASFGDGDIDRWIPWPLRHQLDSAIPDDIIELLVEKALHSSSPEKDRWQHRRESDQKIGERILGEGINTARGACAETLGDILVHDVDGHRTALVAPSLNDLARDPSVAVRACTAHLIAACLRHAQAAALEAFELLVQADDRLLVSHHGENLIAYVSQASISSAEPVIKRMLASQFADVRKAGGSLVAFVGLEFGRIELLNTARKTSDMSVKSGIASVCAYRLTHTSSFSTASSILQELSNDQDKDVRKAVALVAQVLRDQALRPFKSVLISIINAPSFEEAVDQLLITLERAPDRIDDLIIACAQQFVGVFGPDIGNIATRAAGNAREVGQLVLRAYAQVPNSRDRSVALDLIDKLLLSGGYGVDELVIFAERPQLRPTDGTTI